MRALHIGVIVSLLLLSGCASREATEQQVAAQNSGDPRDPFESVNRELWDFNYDILDAYVLRPVTVAYVDYMPQFARTGLYNMALNLEEPSNTVNNLLQGKVDGTFISLGRFLINSTIGLLGSIDVATHIGLERREEEFGEVLGKWGVDTGPYLMVPALGPNDVRSGTGDLVDSAYFPLDNLNIYVSILRSGIKALEARATLMQQEQQLEQSLDPYTFVKTAYFQNLEFKVTDGAVGEDVDAEAPDAQQEALSDEELEDIDALLDDL
ncbi:VacJ family lipoprotein [Aestuariibacter halophilus]|uniref:VacJ family lipoprotein n=1 Tax=Fluctibacter halophilus TaxID=226011 RepID=A0ABS8G2V2_9ALTE|nr:VacJ family lipoprotein [Aestuariibacter halophilus]MCC2614798.1 VacJ family lipoprotein [Aestuariibacter halophilus]